MEVLHQVTDSEWNNAIIWRKRWRALRKLMLIRKKTWTFHVSIDKYDMDDIARKIK